jgi:mitogen-activated protein kinase-activated protein kinase 2
MYILCCGYPPFYSTQGKRLSPGMEKRIKRGQFDYPDSEWSLISDQAKALIDGMLETQPDNRLTIDKIMKNKWLIVRCCFDIINFSQLESNKIVIL